MQILGISASLLLSYVFVFYVLKNRVSAYWCVCVYLPPSTLVRFDSSKSHDKSHPIIGNGTIQIVATYVAETLKRFLHYFLPVSMRLA